MSKGLLPLALNLDYYELIIIQYPIEDLVTHHHC